MPSASDQWYSLNVSQLIKKTGQGAPGAHDALEKYNKLKRVGGEPLTFFSGSADSGCWMTMIRITGVVFDGSTTNRSRILARCVKPFLKLNRR